MTAYTPTLPWRDPSDHYFYPEPISADRPKVRRPLSELKGGNNAERAVALAYAAAARFAGPIDDGIRSAVNAAIIASENPEQARAELRKTVYVFGSLLLAMAKSAYVKANSAEVRALVYYANFIWTNRSLIAEVLLNAIATAQDFESGRGRRTKTRTKKSA